ncbi:ribosome biogenesis GTPase YlqF [Salimicrobium jeotgali]|uniref:Ribosome biogenesis GTPase A n=1 Tax=Salimicrobium jeotgali TaxID=1230341 RepID=K2GQZ5_9BACI|nr:ribosome biogenesis GTPase YlqF [Salimicrobium jeotgali]AKG04593.1 ribosome biogenesis GTPase YlqF [Salimicrobium jeotgali]EKE32809.1 ribosomal biogenesis GTPase [Salimicrobium jeotgali]MBM7695202.1 ribosome biogenesis GTPase A [Salimicrobium jeotgali]
MSIQWYPGHMAKARREVKENLKLVDFVIELVDARAPLSSQNPMLQEEIQDKPKLVVMMKQDLADPGVTKEWIDYFDSTFSHAVAVDVNNPKNIQKIAEASRQITEEKLEKQRAKGVNPRNPRAMIVGIPNVGKSSLINRLAHKKKAETGDKPGVTKKQQWIKVKNEFELLDTPGILWPKFEEEVTGFRLAAIGTIKDQVLPQDEVAIFILNHLKERYPEQLEERFGFSDFEDVVEAFDKIGKKRGALEAGGVVDYEKVAEIIIQDLRSNRIGRISFERP